MQFTNILSAVALLAGSCSAVPHSKRAQATTDVTLYAYGTNISGLPILYGNADGLAYIGASASGNTTSALSWDISTSGDVAWNATVVNGTSGGAFYIVNGGNTNDQAGFATTNTTLATNATTIGFSLFGGQVVFISGNSYLSQFWITEESTGLWSLTWNSAGTNQDNSVPVTVKTLAPSTATSDTTASTS